jgi:hypothetical protein
VCRSLPAICSKRSCGTTQCGCQSWAESKTRPVSNVHTTSYQKTNASLAVPFWVFGILQLQQPCSQHPKCGSTQRGKDEGPACLASGRPMRPPQPVAFQLLAHHGHIYIETYPKLGACTCAGTTLLCATVGSCFEELLAAFICLESRKSQKRP